MAKLSEKDIEHLATLAKLTLKKSEIEKFKNELSEIVTYVDELNKVDTRNTKPTSQTTGLENVTREDKTRPSMKQEDVLSGTDKIKNGYFVVDRLIDK